MSKRGRALRHRYGRAKRRGEAPFAVGVRGTSGAVIDTTPSGQVIGFAPSPGGNDFARYYFWDQGKAEDFAKAHGTRVLRLAGAGGLYR